MNHNDNPARRLLLFLEKGQKVDENKTVGKALAEIFTLDSDQLSGILRCLGEIQKLPMSIRKQIKSIENDSSLYLNKITRVEQALSNINFGAKWRSFKQRIDEATLTELKFSSKLLSDNSIYKPLYDDDLSKLKEKVQSFKNDLSSFEIDHDLSQLIFEKVSEVERAIFDYQLTGSAQIQKEVESALASIALKPTLASKDVGAVRKFFNFLGDISVSLHLIEYTPELNEFMQLLLDKGTG